MQTKPATRCDIIGDKPKHVAKSSTKSNPGYTHDFQFFTVAHGDTLYHVHSSFHAKFHTCSHGFRPIDYSTTEPEEQQQ